MFRLDPKANATVRISPKTTVPYGYVLKAPVVLQRTGWECILRKGDPAQPIEVPIAGAQKLRLSVTDAGDGINSDHATWADAKLQ